MSPSFPWAVLMAAVRRLLAAIMAIVGSIVNNIESQAIIAAVLAVRVMDISAVLRLAKTNQFQIAVTGAIPISCIMEVAPKFLSTWQLPRPKLQGSEELQIHSIHESGPRTLR